MGAARAKVWTYINALADSLEGDWGATKTQLESLEEELRSLPSNEKNKIRRKMMDIVAELSRLEIRLLKTDGPVDKFS